MSIVCLHAPNGCARSFLRADNLSEKLRRSASVTSRRNSALLSGRVGPHSDGRSISKLGRNYMSENSVTKLAKLLESGAKRAGNIIGKCTWIDSDGNQRCNDFSQFQCQQVNGSWDSTSRCDSSTSTSK